MLHQKPMNGEFSKILAYYRTGCGVLGILALGCGIIYSLFSMIQFGVMQCLIMIMLACLLRIRKYERPAIMKEDNLEICEDKAGEARQESSHRTTPAAEQKVKNYRHRYYPLVLLVTVLIIFLVEVYIFNKLKFTANFDKPPILIGVFSLLASFLYLASANWFEQNTEHGEEYQMLSYFFRAAQWLSFSGSLGAVAKYLGFARIEHFLSYLMAAFVAIILLETGLQCAIRLTDGKQKYSFALKMTILPALLSGENPVRKLLISIEKNAGISFRSTWTIGFIRRNVLFVMSLLMIFFWLMTVFVQINPDEKGILYHFGSIKRARVMLPGIHIKWPWPIEIVKIYPVYQVQNFTVGYESNRQTDYIWTMSHGGDEYQLLLGDGRELVSINMQVYYKIDNLYEYVLQFENPEEILKVEAYRILLNETVATDLDKLLSRDRSLFSKMITQKLRETSKQQKLGLEVTGVALTNIHPPTEIAYEYQEIVSADIQKRTIIIKARTDAEASIPKAEQTRDEMIKNSRTDALTRKGQALSEFNKYKYQENAYRLNPAAYKEWKWLEVMENSLENKKIYLLDKRQTMNKDGFWLDMRGIFNEKNTNSE